MQKKKDTMINKHILKNSWANSPGENSKDAIMLITYENSNQGEKMHNFLMCVYFVKERHGFEFFFLMVIFSFHCFQKPL